MTSGATSNGSSRSPASSAPAARQRRPPWRFLAMVDGAVRYGLVVWDGGVGWGGAVVVVGDAVVGDAVVGDAVVGGAVVGDAVVGGGALDGGRVGSGGELGLGAPLGPAVVLVLPALLLVAASARLPPAAAGPTLEAVAVGPTAAAVIVVPDGAVRSAPVNLSQADPQPVLRVTSTKATTRSTPAVTEIVDSRTRRRSHQACAIQGTTSATRLCSMAGRGSPLPTRALGGRMSRASVGCIGTVPASAADSSWMPKGPVSTVRLGSGGRSWLLSFGSSTINRPR